MRVHGPENAGRSRYKHTITEPAAAAFVENAVQFSCGGDPGFMIAAEARCRAHDRRCMRPRGTYSKGRIDGTAWGSREISSLRSGQSAYAKQSRYRRSAGRHAGCRRHVGRRRFCRDGCAPQGRRLRRGRRYAPVVRSWRRHASQGRLLRRPGHPRRPHGCGQHRYPALRSRL